MTDWGSEHLILDVPDCLEAFLAWVSGSAILEVKDLVHKGRRLMRNCIRLSGWSHLLGHIMKQVLLMVTDWPEWQELIRALCRIFRSKTYREYLQWALRHTDLGLDTKIK